MVQLIIARNDVRTAIVGEVPNEDDVAAALTKLNESGFGISKQSFPGSLTSSQLVEIFNALVPAEKATKRFATRAAGVKRVLEAWEAYKKTNVTAVEAAPKKKAGARRGRTAAPIEGKIELIPFKHSKRWQKDSARSRAYFWLEKHDGVKVETAISKLAEDLSLNRGQVRGLLNKLVGVKALRFSAEA